MFFSYHPFNLQFQIFVEKLDSPRHPKIRDAEKIYQFTGTDDDFRKPFIMLSICALYFNKVHSKSYIEFEYLKKMITSWGLEVAYTIILMRWFVPRLGVFPLKVIFS